MTNFLLKSESGVEGLQAQVDDLDIHSDTYNSQPLPGGIFDGNQYPGDDKWQDLLLPPGMEISKDDALPLDLNTLLRVLDHHAKDAGEDPSYSTWQLVLIQCMLLLLLVIVSVLWACCCRKRCLQAAPPSVHEALRKLSSSGSIKSRDFPPSYSQADLHTLAMSVHDYLYPPPQYPDVFNRSSDELAYLDLEDGHNRLAKLSFSSPPSFYSATASNNTTASNLIPAIPLSRQSSTFSSLSSSSSLESRRSSTSVDSAGSRKNSIMKDTSSRKSSNSQDSRRSSRVSFSEAVECSNGSYRRLAGPPVDLLRKDSSHEVLSRKESLQDILLRRASAQEILARKGSSPDLISLSRKGSSSSSSSGEGSRRGSLLLSRKLGLSQESLDKELRKKLESIEIEERALELREEKRKAAEEERMIEQARKRLEEERRRGEEEKMSLDTVLEVEPSILETVVEIEKY